MNSKERMNCVLHGLEADRIPVMCQLSLGHVYKNIHMDPVDFWYTSEGFAEGLICMADKYSFDGILVVRQGRDPEIKGRIDKVEKSGDGHMIIWKNGVKTFAPPDEYPYDATDKSVQASLISIEDFDISSVKIIESAKCLPYYYFDVMDHIIRERGRLLSIHGEVGTAFEKFLPLFGNYENGLMALIDDEYKSMEIMKILNKEVVIQALAQCGRGIDALKLSSPFAGAGFISRIMYEKFVLPFEKEVIDTVHAQYGTPCYIHTCGKIGDRLDLIVRTGIDGIECLDPYPLGDVDLEKAVEEIGDKVFIKGNLDSVNELSEKNIDTVKEIAKNRIAIGKKNKKGYILSSACSVSPKVPPENIMILYNAVEEYGRY